MAPRARQVTRGIGLTLFLAFLGLVVVASLIRDPFHRDTLFVLVRWPLWVIAGVLAPLAAVRIVLWHRRRRVRAAPGSGPRPAER